MKNCIKKHRELIGLSQGDLAKALNVSRQTINSIENGKFDPSLPLAIKLTKFFSEPIDTLFEFEE
jgi:putative transcriptional regulator